MWHLQDYISNGESIYRAISRLKKKKFLRVYWEFEGFLLEHGYIEEDILKPEYQPNGLLDELQYLQENNKEVLQEAERLLKRLSEATWQFELKTGCTPVINS